VSFAVKICFSESGCDLGTREVHTERCELFDHAARLCRRRALLRVRGEFLAEPRDGFFLLWKPATESLPLCCHWYMPP